MTQDTIKSTYQEIIKLAESGQYMDIVNTYYDSGITKSDNGKVTSGDDALASEHEFYEGDLVTGIETKLLEVAYGDNLVMSKWFLKFNHKEWGQIEQNQMVLTKFNDDGKIIYEEYIYPTSSN